MKKFDTPRMERINLVRQNIMAASLCNSKYCCGYTCDECDKEGCMNVEPCRSYNCQRHLCQTYQGTACL